MVKYTGINHLALVTGDMDATIAFWRDLLGLSLVAGLGRPGNRHYFFALSEHDMIAFFEWPGVSKLPPKDHGVPVRGPVGFDHVSMAVAADDDLWELKDRLTAAGFWVSEVIDHGFIHSIYSFDPNEIPIEFSAPVAAVDLRKNPQMTDTNPSPLALEGAAPVSHRWPAVKEPTPVAQRRIYPGEGTRFRDDGG